MDRWRGNWFDRHNGVIVRTGVDSSVVEQPHGRQGRFFGLIRNKIRDRFLRADSPQLHLSLVHLLHCLNFNVISPSRALQLVHVQVEIAVNESREKATVCTHVLAAFFLHVAMLVCSPVNLREDIHQRKRRDKAKERAKT